MKTSPRILHVITSIDRGGAENHLMDLIRHQRRSGVEVTVAYLRGKGYWAAELRRLGVSVCDLALRYYGDLSPLRKLRRILKTNAFDLIHAHLPPAELYARIALLGANKKRTPMIISKHNDCAFHRLPGERAMGRWVARRASSVIAISDAVRRYMVEPTLGIEPEKVKTIRYGIDVNPFERVELDAVAALRREWNAAEKTLVIGCVARLVEQKSLDTLLHAFALFIRRGVENAKLVIVGDGPLKNALQRCAKMLGIADQVVWAGFREDIPLVMNAFDVFAITSVFEGFGLVLIEAMAARRPVVATRAGAIPEIVVDGVTGFLAPPREPELLAKAFEKLTDHTLRERFGKAGRERVESHFTLKRMWQETDAAYFRCIQTSQQPDDGASAPAAAALIS
jgi:glycosyltransferase involved in cell wall biosynthesis